MYFPSLPLTEFPGQFFLSDLRNPQLRMDYCVTHQSCPCCEPLQSCNHILATCPTYEDQCQLLKKASEDLISIRHSRYWGQHWSTHQLPTCNQHVPKTTPPPEVSPVQKWYLTDLPLLLGHAQHHVAPLSHQHIHNNNTPTPPEVSPTQHWHHTDPTLFPL